MSKSTATPFVVAAALSACALESELLNSERIGERFGSYGIEVLGHDPTVRRSNLYSVEDGLRICRTYAVVRFEAHGSGSVADLHDRIIAGESIGATFKAAGWHLSKETFHIGSIELPDTDHAVARLMHLEQAAALAVHAYWLMLTKDGRELHYATIIETHHPDYLTEADLEVLYEVVTSGDAAPITLKQLSHLVLQVESP